MLWEPEIVAGTATIIPCGGNTQIANKIEDIFRGASNHLNDRIFIHFDTLNCYTLTGVQYLADISEVINKYNIATFWFKFHSFEQFIMETFVLDDLLVNYNSTPAHLQMLACIRELHECYKTDDFTRFTSTAYIKDKYPAVFPVNLKSSTVESVVSSCCSQASQLLHRRFKIEKTSLGYCWSYSCFSSSRNCNDPTVPNVRLCATNCTRILDIFKLFHCTNIFDLYTSQGYNLVSDNSSKTSYFI